MKTLLAVALLLGALGVWAYNWRDTYHSRPMTSLAAATTPPGGAQSNAARVDPDAVKKQCFNASKEAILKELKTPQSAHFADTLSDVQLVRREADSYFMSSYVDAENALGARIRMKWETLFDKNEKLVWMRIDNDELEPLDVVLRRLKALSSSDAAGSLASDESDGLGQAPQDTERQEVKELRDPKNRETLHAYAETYVTTRMELQSHHAIKHSKLLKKDDKYTACYWLGNDVWEASGLVESIPPNRTRLVRQPWRISMAVSKENKPEVLAYKMGKDEIGNQEAPRIRAGVQPTLSK